VGFFLLSFFLFLLFSCGKQRFQVPAREERWVLEDFRWSFAQRQIYKPRLVFLQQELFKCDGRPLLVRMVIFRGCAVRPWSVVTRTRRRFSSYAFACVGYNCFSPVLEDADLSLWKSSVAWKVPGEGACFTRAVSSLRFLPVSAVWVSVCICFCLCFC
jgi:hypothetical protein